MILQGREADQSQSRLNWEGEVLAGHQCQGADQGSCPFSHSFPHVPVQFFHFQVYMLILSSQGCSSAGFIEGFLGAWLLLKNSSGEQTGRSRTFFEKSGFCPGEDAFIPVESLLV